MAYLRLIETLAMASSASASVEAIQTLMMLDNQARYPVQAYLHFFRHTHVLKATKRSDLSCGKRSCKNFEAYEEHNRQQYQKHNGQILTN